MNVKLEILASEYIKVCSLLASVLRVGWSCVGPRLKTQIYLRRYTKDRF